MAGRKSGARRAPYVLATIAIVWAAVEILSCAAYRPVTGESFSFEGIRESQREIAATVPTAPSARQPRTTLERMMAADAIHPYLGFVYDPEAWNPDNRSLDAHGVPVSDFGFVDDKPPIQGASEDRVVIGVFGGSLALQLGLRGMEAMIDELRGLPRFAGDREFVVVRTALGSHKQPQQSIALDYLLSLGAHFDVVVNLDGFNEVALAAENRRKGVSPFYPRGWSARMAGVPEVGLLKLIGAKLLVEESRREWANAFLDGSLRYSAAGALVWKLRDRQLSGRVAVLALGIQQFATDREQTPYEARGPAFEPPGEADLYREVARIWAASSLQMSRLAAANGIAYFHFLQPNQYVPDSKVLGPEERAVAFNPRHPYRRGVEMGYPQLVEAAGSLTREGVEFYDLTPMFASVARPLYSDSCCHLNDEGLRLLGARIGGIIHTALTERGATAARPRGGDRTP